MSKMAHIAEQQARALDDVLAAELWASRLVGAWPNSGDRRAAGVDERALPEFVKALEKHATAGALTTLRAMTGVGVTAHRRLAAAAGDRLAAGGLPEPAWASQVGQARATVALLLCEEIFNDAATLEIEFEGPGFPTHTLGVVINHNLCGALTAAGLLAQEESGWGDSTPTQRFVARELGLGEAGVRLRRALEIHDQLPELPADESVGRLRAFIKARLGALPDGPALSEPPPPTARERRALQADFLSSPEGTRWRGEKAAEEAVEIAIAYGCLESPGDPLRWSPTAILLFMCSWVPNMVLGEPASLRRVADVLPDWIAYACRRRGGVPDAAIGIVLSEVERCRGDMLELLDDASRCTPAQDLAIDAGSAGIDVSDPEACGEFLARWNAERQAEQWLSASAGTAGPGARPRRRCA